MHMRTELIFDRDPRPANSHFDQNLRRFEKAISKSVERPADLADTEAFMQSVGEDACRAVASWAALAFVAHAGKPIALDDVLTAGAQAAHYSETFHPYRSGSDHNRAMAGITLSTDVVFTRATDPIVRLFAAACSDHLRVITEANYGNVVYRDDHLLISWRSCFGKEKAELYICVRHAETGIWTWLPQAFADNIVPPVSSFRAARKAIANWRGQTLTGELVGSSAVRLCKLLGIQVQGNIGVIHGNRRKPKGF